MAANPNIALSMGYVVSSGSNDMLLLQEAEFLYNPNV